MLVCESIRVYRGEYSITLFFTPFLSHNNGYPAIIQHECRGCEPHLELSKAQRARELPAMVQEDEKCSEIKRFVGGH